MKTITLTVEEYNTLLSELRALEIYRWNDNRIPAAESPSKVLPVIERRAFTVGNNSVAQQETLEAWDKISYYWKAAVQNPPAPAGILLSLQKPGVPEVTVEPLITKRE